MPNLTKKQKEILDFITQFIQTNDYAPSYREIADYFGLSSTATVHEHIKALEDKGLITSGHNMARSLEIIKHRFGQSIELPLAGLITAGEPIEAIQDNEMIAVPSTLVKDENSYVLKVRGESMIEEGILDGDYVIVERNFYPKNGDVVVALLDNTYATLKKYYREKDRIRLQPANKTMKPIYAQNPSIQGIVRAILRTFI
ncbi:MAG: repressor LexA [Candidatus Komeilibacteria bacterium CG11_big_fil_rev_8_21_14_0_20_36_20]|uniref:LexA repressor n=1 Tax=Candidatus Komeilibacteria bacterium CG11_big_fil_rev_8_21_14_0_20_36_20 TaxID=1974477 RepID=A0A2H0NBQ2_9BACT|nr:MAG: repressor LexA [Candidatus Komeilibacteria bacterium CG11_big_fil_rev_8_21_14_0_20_36_20]PIR81436.1 MAG: repressor LexA [Candidatus Komeilibacteria bacterium CG10_big_fil_rev_8_21_14_0_10_36_65]PJC55637.1 MAG: repressor LexA [Candidatus Komeilibacteria bacterium CG_4_9_14_0_2_um_filter_36_13]